MKFNKIVDVTESENSLVQTHSEREANSMLQYDETDLINENRSEYEVNDEEALEHDLAIIYPETVELMDDWKCAELKVDEIVSDPNVVEEFRYELSLVGSDSSLDSFFKPEADQNIQLLSEEAVSAMRHQNNDYATITRVDEE